MKQQLRGHLAMWNYKRSCMHFYSFPTLPSLGKVD